MHLILLPVATRNMNTAAAAGPAELILEAEPSIDFGSVWWFIYAGISCFLVLFAGIKSGLTLGLMSLCLVDLEILQRSGTPAEKKQAGISQDSMHKRRTTRGKKKAWRKKRKYELLQTQSCQATRRFGG